MSYSTIIQTPFLLLFLLFHSCTSMKSPHSDPDGEELSDDLLLWYEKPATDWMTEALPIGNGYIRAEEHTGELQQSGHMVSNLLLSKKRMCLQHTIVRHYA